MRLGAESARGLEPACLSDENFASYSLGLQLFHTAAPRSHQAQRVGGHQQSRGRSQAIAPLRSVSVVACGHPPNVAERPDEGGLHGGDGRDCRVPGLCRSCWPGIADGVSVIGCHRALVASTPTVSKARIMPDLCGRTGVRRSSIWSVAGAAFGEMARALLREPDPVNCMSAGHVAQICIH